MNRDNLALMPPFIRTIPQRAFHMATFRNGQKKNPECDSLGCVIGHCTVLDNNPLPIFLSGRIDFITWSEKFTGVSDDEWLWCFSSDWSATDNTPKGAALRIEWLLQNGLPENWEEQLEGDTPLCYKI